MTRYEPITGEGFCEICGSHFYRHRGNTQKYCSPQCRQAAAYRRRRLKVGKIVFGFAEYYRQRKMGAF